MALSSSMSKAALIIGAALVCGGLVGWLATRSPSDSSPAPVTETTLAPATNTASNGAGPVTKTSPSAAAEELKARLRASRMRQSADDTNAVTELSEWQQKIDDIILADEEIDQKSERILALLPTLKDSEQRVEAVQHLVNFVTDTNYATTATLLVNPKTDEAVLQTLMADLLNRGNELKLPIFLQLAKDDQHPLVAEARELLQIYIQDDHGTNWPAWDKAVQQWLKETVPEE
ncbi:MAG: hypothetical protein H7X97_09510 [Opitutaceae bacterium]|nr:hypothetical protein [Verrucomicrobiales bacterium]